MTSTILTRLGALVLLASASATAAMSDTTGEAEYMTYCAVCHGEMARGGGSLAPLLNVPIPNLATLAKENDGEFPFLRVIQSIDGRSGVLGHGGPMPVWGNRFAAHAGDVGSVATEIEVRGRVLSLAYYLLSIQEE